MKRLKDRKPKRNRSPRPKRLRNRRLEASKKSKLKSFKKRPKKKQSSKAKTNKILNTLLWCYVEPGNHTHARKFGKKLFGSHSAYVNALIAKDRGVKPKLGSWKAKGESDKLRKARKKK